MNRLLKILTVEFIMKLFTSQYDKYLEKLINQMKIESYTTSILELNIANNCEWPKKVVENILNFFNKKRKFYTSYGY